MAAEMSQEAWERRVIVVVLSTITTICGGGFLFMGLAAIGSAQSGQWSGGHTMLMLAFLMGAVVGIVILSRIQSKV